MQPATRLGPCRRGANYRSRISEEVRYPGGPVSENTSRSCLRIPLASLTSFYELEPCNPDYFGTSKRLGDEEATIVQGWSQSIAEQVDAAIDCYERTGHFVLPEWDDTLKSYAAENSHSWPALRRMILKKLPELRTAYNLSEFHFLSA